MGCSISCKCYVGDMRRRLVALENHVEDAEKRIKSELKERLQYEYRRMSFLVKALAWSIAWYKSDSYFKAEHPVDIEYKEQVDDELVSDQKLVQLKKNEILLRTEIQSYDYRMRIGTFMCDEEAQAMREWSKTQPWHKKAESVPVADTAEPVDADVDKSDAGLDFLGLGALSKTDAEEVDRGFFK